MNFLYFKLFSDTAPGHLHTSLLLPTLCQAGRIEPFTLLPLLKPFLPQAAIMIPLDAFATAHTNQSCSEQN